MSASPERAATEPRLVEALRGPLVSLLLPGSLLTSTAFYFGWVYVRASYAQYGLDPSVVGLSTTDYVLRSMNVLVPAFERAAMAVLATGAGVWLLATVTQRGGERARRLVRAAAIVVMVTAALPWARLTGDAVIGALLPVVMLAVGAASFHLAALESRRPRHPYRDAGHRLATAIARMCLALVILGSVFDLVRAYASNVGVTVARQNQRAIAGSLTNPANGSTAAGAFPYVVIYSTVPLHLADDVPSVVQTTFNGGSAPMYRTCGLRLFVRSDHHLFVWPAWRSMAEGMIRLDDGADLRVELIRDGTPAAASHCPAA